MSAYDSILQGLNEALAYAEAPAEDSVTHQVRVPAMDGAAIRTRTGSLRHSSPGASGSPRAPSELGT